MHVPSQAEPPTRDASCGAVSNFVTRVPPLRQPPTSTEGSTAARTSSATPSPASTPSLLAVNVAVARVSAGILQAPSLTRSTSLPAKERDGGLWTNATGFGASTPAPRECCERKPSMRITTFSTQCESPQFPDKPRSPFRLRSRHGPDGCQAKCHLRREGRHIAAIPSIFF